MNEITEQPTHRIEPRQCELHGQYQATATATTHGGKPFVHYSKCPACVAEAAANLKRQEEQDRRRKVRRLRCESGVPARFADADFASYRPTSERMQATRDLLSRFATRWDAQALSGQSLLLVGGPGTGKTHLACAVINTIAEGLTPATYGTAAGLIGRVKRNYGQRGGNADNAIEELQSVPLLVIDEIDVGLSEHDLTLLFRVVDSRYADMQPMVLISNRPVDQLDQLLGQRVMDRLRECAVTVAFDWPSHRGQPPTGIPAHSRGPYGHRRGYGWPCAQ